MHQAGGFATEDYDVMEKSCNNFTHCLAKKLKVDYKYPEAILKQSKMGEFFAPVAHALDMVAEKSSFSLTTFEENDETYSLLCRKKCKVRRYVFQYSPIIVEFHRRLFSKEDCIIVKTTQNSVFYKFLIVR